VSVRNIILVVADTLRADRLGCYGDRSASTAFVDRLAVEGVRFEHAYAPSSWTMPSVASLFTSRYPSQHRVADLSSRLSESETTLAERLSEAGYRTGGFTANWRLTEENGFAQGFKTWLPLFPDLQKENKVRADEVRSSVDTWLDEEVASPHRPFFLYLQYLEPHAPMEPPRDLRERLAPGISDDEVARINAKTLDLTPDTSKGMTPAEVATLVALYRAEVTALDRGLQVLFADLDRRGLLAHTLVIFTADHGEEFLEHGCVGHGYNLFNETVRVPLIFSGARIEPGVISDTVSLIDLAPTVLEIVGLAREPRFEGASHARLLRSGRVTRLLWRMAGLFKRPSIILELPKDTAEYDVRAHEFGVIRGTDKLLVTSSGASSVFDLQRDPGEHDPTGNERTRATLAAILQTKKEEIANRSVIEKENVTVDPATLERLRALGYHQ
jgi:arylsulfatase A-like enzyme